MKILVTGGTGTVGSEVVHELLKRDAKVSVLTRDASKPLPAGARAVEGNLLDVNSVRQVFNGVDAVFLLNPVSQTYDLVGPDVVTGESTARTWASALGKPIRYGGDDLDAWEAVQVNYLPHWMVFDFREMYLHFQQQGLKASPDALARQTQLLGRAPRSFESFAAETAAAWTGSAAAR